MIEMNKLSVNNFKYFDYPLKLEINDYKDALEEVKLKYAKDCKSIYTFGAISSPGISDIDIIVIPKNKIKTYRFSKKSRYLLYHPFFVISKNILENIRYIYPSADFKYITGEKIKIKNLSKEEIKLAKISLMTDLIIRHLPRDFLETILSPRINIRNALLRLNSLSHTITMLKEITKKEQKNWGDYSKSISGLRKNWFSMNKSKREEGILKLNKIGLEICLEIIEFFNNYLIKNILTKNQDNGKNNIFMGFRNKSIFTINWDKKNSINQSLKIYSEKKELITILPISFSFQLYEYAKEKGPLSNYLKKKLNYNNNLYSFKRSDIIKKRIYLLNEQVDLAIKTKHSEFPCFLPFGYKSKAGIKNKIKYLIIKHNIDELIKRHFDI